jgi:phospholipid/cholesterol/gamma-HCH transport system permease protein
MDNIRRDNGVLYIDGPLDKFTAPGLFPVLAGITNWKDIHAIDLHGIVHVDSAGVALLDEIRARITQAGGASELANTSPEILEAIETFTSLGLSAEAPPRPAGFFENAGSRAIAAWDSFVSGLFLTSDILYWSIRDTFGGHGHRKGSLVQQGVQIGVEALGIIGLVAFILGLILGLQSAAQLRQFGANIFMADLLAISLVREMGPLITAILLAGRSGSAIASEIATMKVTEELDALRMMAINPIRYVVVPKFQAVTLCMPILVAMSIMLGLFGGLIIAVSYLGLTATAYVNECIKVLTPSDLFVGFSKSVFFAWVIVIIGCFNGFRVEGGAEGVGRATTDSVVASIFAVIILDALFSLFYLV